MTNATLLCFVCVALLVHEESYNWALRSVHIHGEGSISLQAGMLLCVLLERLCDLEVITVQFIFVMIL